MTKDMAEKLRTAIRKSGLSLSQLARETGVPQPRITVFLQGKDIRLSTAQKLMARLGLELVKKPEDTRGSSR